MKKCSNCWAKLSIHPLTPIVIAIALLSLRHKALFVFLFAALIHELGHIIMAYALGVKVERIVMLPFGFRADFNLNTISMRREFLIVLAGPLMYFVNHFLFAWFFRLGGFSWHGYQQAKSANLVLLLFNLLPLYPLDGYRLVQLLLGLFLPIKKTLLFGGLISLLALSALVIYNLSAPQYLLLGYLSLMQAQYLVELHQRWITLLLSHPRDCKRVKIHSRRDFYRPYANYLWLDGNLHDEATALAYIIRPRQKKP